MKLRLSFALLLYVGLVLSQSKKEQIEQLTNRVDSLNSVLRAERKSNTQKITDYTTQITSLNVQVSRLTADVQTNKTETATMQQDLQAIKAQLKVKQDSLTLVNVELQNLKPTVRTVVNTAPRINSLSGLEKITAFIPPAIEDDPIIDLVLMQDQLLETEVSDEDFDFPEDFDPPSPHPDHPVTFVEEEADFPGGFREMVKFINDNIDYPQEAIDLGIKGRVTVRFVVEKDGRVSNVSVVGSLDRCKACDSAAVQVVEKMPPWTAGKNGGRAVRTWVTLPIKFEVEEYQGPKPPKPLEEMTKKERRKWEKEL
jgi:TonB family protein